MKSPVRMIEDIAAQISEGRVLLQNIYRESEENEKTDCSIACLLRSLDKTIDNAYSYASQCSNTKKTQPTLTSEPAVGSTMTWPTEASPTNQLTIGARIRELRKERQLTQADIAEAVNVSTQAICLWENDNASMSVDKLIPLATALKCDPIWLLTGNPVDVKPAQPAPINVMKGADLANIGVRIESRRNYIEMSLNKLAEEIDTSGAMIREWETGKAIPHSDYIDKLAKALNVTVTWLMTGKDINAETPAKIVNPEMLFITVKHNVPAYYNDKYYSETGKAITDALVNYTNRLHNDGYEPWTTSMEEVITEDNTYITIQRGICNNENELPLPKVERMSLNRSGVGKVIL